VVLVKVAIPAIVAKFNFKKLNECKIRAADVDWWLGGVNPINDVTYNFNL
jgi:hypothetical protein